MIKSYLFPLFDPSNGIRLKVLKRTRILLKEKLTLVLLFNLWISLPYFILQRFPIFPATPMKETAIDRLIPFDDRAVWLYLSLYVFIPIAPFLMVSTSELRQYTFGLGLLSLISHFFFLFYPTAILRPDPAATNWAYRWVVGIDGSLNACPSLHASLAIFSGLWCERLLSQTRQSWGWRSIVWLWVLAILYATLATRQHVILDLLGGTAVALIVYAFIFGERMLSNKFSFDSPSYD